jgi:hypothetical protein
MKMHFSTRHVELHLGDTIYQVVRCNKFQWFDTYVAITDDKKYVMEGCHLLGLAIERIWKTDPARVAFLTEDAFGEFYSRF